MHDQHWAAAALAAAALAAGLAGTAGGATQDISVTMESPGLARASFATAYEGPEAAKLRGIADRLGSADGAVSAAEADNLTQRAAADLRGQPMLRVFLDGFPGTVGVARVSAQGIEGSASAQGPAAMVAETLLVLPELPGSRHVLLVLPHQNGTLSLQPPPGWRVGGAAGAEPPADGGSLSAAIREDQPLQVELVQAGAPGPGASGAGAAVKAVPGLALPLALAAAAAGAWALRRRG